MDEQEARQREGIGPPPDADLGRFLQTMPAAFCFLDKRWNLHYVNAEAERLLGRSWSELAGQSLWEAVPELVGSDVETHYRTAVATGRPLTFEAAHPGVGGWFEIRAWPTPDGLAVYLLDVTDRRDAEEAARRATARTALLARVSAELSGQLDTLSALARLAQLVVPVLADACIVTLVDREGHARDVGSWHGDPARRPVMDRYAQLRLATLPGTSPVAQALAAGTPVTESVDAVLRVMPEGPARDLLVELSPATAVVLPLTADARTVGVLTLYQDADRVMRAEDTDTAWQVAAEAARAIARVHRHSQQAQLAETLQRSLLTEPPAVDGLAVVVRYVPAAEAARVGGDWYDAFLQRDDALMVVIGDVVGHDTAAAAAMGQLRGLLRGIAHYSGAGPAEVLRGLDDAVVGMHDDTLATAAIVRFEQDGQGGPRLRWANAGHPPPIVVAADGGITVLGSELGDLMLGVDPTAVRAESVVALPPGTTVLLHTDGLIERRDSSLDDGTRTLLGHLRELAGRPLEELCDGLLRRMLRGIPQDDVALVAVRCAGAHPAGAGTQPPGRLTTPATGHPRR
ncbi:SpoIIE family protein phosphatase [Blastococcus haudaquaticus]|uniref:PAS domain S-box-containing protein n=1 Tax=Blastococcus haudaquaticus TaxID=1938745 RepID=A0A286GIB9_9ACTN|nr:SpoIIE family protein phosphatase [Blastococcus haudaquaticus]SOD95271.1 PAS domain S-box-containing protein [Blastococcus haudaquaticus]